MQKQVRVAKMDWYFECISFFSGDSRQPFGTISVNGNHAGFPKGGVVRHIRTPSRLSPSVSITFTATTGSTSFFSAKEFSNIYGYTEWKIFSSFSKTAVFLRSRAWWILRVALSQDEHTQAQNKSLLWVKSKHLPLTSLVLLWEEVSTVFSHQLCIHCFSVSRPLLRKSFFTSKP